MIRMNRKPKTTNHQQNYNGALNEEVTDSEPMPGGNESDPSEWDDRR